MSFFWENSFKIKTHKRNVRLYSTLKIPHIKGYNIFSVCMNVTHFRCQPWMNIYGKFCGQRRWCDKIAEYPYISYWGLFFKGWQTEYLVIGFHKTSIHFRYYLRQLLTLVRVFIYSKYNWKCFSVYLHIFQWYY